MSGAPEALEQRLVIAVDYGTTYTGVAYATTTTGKAILDDIDIVQDWGPGMANDDKVPSVIAYSLGKERNWGSNLSSEAIAMVHTKLQLDVSETTAELDLILQALDGMHDLKFEYIKGASGTRKYTNKAPEQIVQDYLTEVLEYVIINWAESYRKVTPVDIVATIPASWTYGAKNSLFRALNRAGFNRDNFKKLEQMLLLSEPEAAAIYTARYLKEKNPDSVPLKKNECFVLCDAGGGTVDVVSYQVKQFQPTLEIEIVSIPTSFKCGSTFINVAFKQWLCSLIGKSNYLQLNPTLVAHKIWSHDAEGKPMRELMNAFDLKKKLFTRENRRDILMTLPSPLNNLSIPNKVHHGQIKISFEDMQSFFEPRVNRIVGLIHDQVEETENKKKRRVKRVFLVGGFAASKYLQESINDSLEERHLRLQIPDTSWTAVVRGAAVFGIEKTLNKITSMDASTQFYGISVNTPFSKVANHDSDRVKDPLTDTEMAKDQLIWMIKKGDLILSTRPKEVRGTFTINFAESEVKTGRIPIYTFDDEEDLLPTRLHNRENDLTTLGVLEYDLRNIPEQHFLYQKAFGPNPAYFVAPFNITMRLTVTSLHVELHLENQHLCEKDFDLTTTNDEERN